MFFCILVDIFSQGIWRDSVSYKHPDLRNLANSLPGTVLSSRQPNTVRVYAYSFQRWKRWSASYREIPSMPVKPQHFALYLLHLAQTAKTNSTITSACSGITWAHKLAGLDSPVLHPLVQMVKESLCRSLGSSGNNSKQPLTVGALIILYNKLAKRSASLLDLRVITMCMLAFTAFLRYDELANICRSDLVFHSDYLAIFITKSKTDVYKQGSWIVVARLPSAHCPVRLLERYLYAARIDPLSSEHIFRSVAASRKSAYGHVLRPTDKPISYCLTRQIMLAAFESIGLSRKLFGTHSLRKGGATAANQHKIPDRLIKKHGRWISDKSKNLYITENLPERLSVSRSLGL